MACSLVRKPLGKAFSARDRCTILKVVWTRKLELGLQSCDITPHMPVGGGTSGSAHFFVSLPSFLVFTVQEF